MAVFVDVPSLMSTYRVQFNSKNYGTAFSLNMKGNNFLVTAAHTVGNAVAGDRVSIESSDGPLYFEIMLMGHCKDESDVCVMKLEERFSDSGNKPQNGGYVIGQEARFCGFPIGLKPRYDMKVLGNRLSPVVKGAMLSGFIERSFEGSKNRKVHKQMLFDALNNRGFSGGPIFINKHHNILKKQELVVIGVVSEYLFDQVPSMDGSLVRSNSGFMIGVPIKNVIAICQSLSAN